MRDSEKADLGNAATEVSFVIIADIQADNGVIRVIDKVLIPRERPACY